MHLVLGLIFSAVFAHAQGALGNGIVNAAGTFGRDIGTVGANANRQAANQLFQQGLADEARGMATLNVGLLSKALTEGLSGVQADDQSKHFGQAAMQALKSGGDAGNVDLSHYGTSEDQIKQFANTSSPLLPQAQSEFDRFGIQVDHSKSVLKTQFGSFPLNTSLDDHIQDLAKAISAIAESHGLSSKDVMAGIKAGLAERDAIAKKAMDQAQQQLAAAQAAGGASSAVNPAAAATPEKTAPSSEVAARDLASKAAALGSGNGKDFDMYQRMHQLELSRAEMKRKMGLSDASQDQLADPSMSLFKIVHDRYQEMRIAGQFHENEFDGIVAEQPHK